MRPTRVVVVDDSSFVRRALARLLGEHEEIEVVAAAASGEELLAGLSRWRPDVVTLDLAMPGIGGLATLDRLREREEPPAVIVLSTHTGPGAPEAVEALHRGAVELVDKQAYSLVDFRSLRNVLTDKILSLGRRRGSEIEPLPAAVPERVEPEAGPVRVLVLGASAGGPPALERVLTDLGAPLPVPVLAAQHMPAGFTAAFAARLDERLPVPVVEAAAGRPLDAGTVYVAPGGSHLRMGLRGGQRIALLEPPSPDGPTPSIDRLLESVAKIEGRHGMGVLLTGMGCDGSRGLLSLRRRGGRAWAQDEASSAIFGIPRAAWKAGAVQELVPLSQLGGRLRAVLSGAS